MIKSQTHNQFAVIVTTPGLDGHISEDVRQSVRDLTLKNPNIEIKSLGVEYLDAKKKVILSLGFRDGGVGYPVDIQSVPLGELGEDPQAISSAMSKAAATVANVICHEFYVDDQGRFFLLLLTHE